MEKLPMNKKKATLLKTWKRRFFRAKDGWLHYYEVGTLYMKFCLFVKLLIYTIYVIHVYVDHSIYAKKLICREMLVTSLSC